MIETHSKIEPQTLGKRQKIATETRGTVCDRRLTSAVGKVSLSESFGTHLIGLCWLIIPNNFLFNLFIQNEKLFKDT